MGRTVMFYALSALALLLVASNADEIEGRHSEASVTETIVVVGGVLLFVFIARAIIARLAEGRK